VTELERVHSRHGVVWLRSPRLAEAGFDHGFSTRHGGVSGGAFASMNLAGERSTGGRDDPSALRENRSRFLAAIGLSGMPLATVRQVHGAEVARAARCVGGDGPSEGADALTASADDRVACMIRVADCVPIVVANLDTGSVAAIHAGWRGIVAGVVGAAVRAIRDMPGHGAPIERTPRRLFAAIGPCAGVEAFEIGEEVADAFGSVHLAACVQRRPAWPRPHVDLFGAVRAQLLASGVDANSIDGTPLCTMTGRVDFFSHRRDAGVTGRMAVVIAPRSGDAKASKN